MELTEIRQILNQISYKDWEFYLGAKGETWYLQVLFDAPAHDDPEAITAHHGRKWLLSPHMTQSEIVQTVLKAVLTAEEHEARELFRYKGCNIYGPHFDVDRLMGLVMGGDIDVRGPMPDESPRRRQKLRITDNRN